MTASKGTLTKMNDLTITHVSEAVMQLSNMWLK